MTQMANTQDALNKIEKAFAIVDALCDGRQRWTMSVPPRPDEDPDLVIAGALKTAKEVIAALQPTEQPEAAQDERSRFEAWTATQRDGWEPISPFDAWQAAKRDAAQAQEPTKRTKSTKWANNLCGFCGAPGHTSANCKAGTAPQERAAVTEDKLRKIVPWYERINGLTDPVAAMHCMKAEIRELRALLSLSAQSSEQTKRSAKCVECGVVVGGYHNGECIHIGQVSAYDAAPSDSGREG